MFTAYEIKDRCNMDMGLYLHIGEVYGVESWQKILDKHWIEDGIGFELWMFDNDVEYDGHLWRSVIIQRCVYDAQLGADDVDHVEMVMALAWKLR